MRLSKTTRTALALAGVVGLMAIAGEVEAQGSESFKATPASIQVREVFNATPVLGWPHVLRRNELRGLQRELFKSYKLRFPDPATRQGTAVRCRNLLGSPYCAVTGKGATAVLGIRIRLYEDGSTPVSFFTPDWN